MHRRVIIIIIIIQAQYTSNNLWRDYVLCIYIQFFLVGAFVVTLTVSDKCKCTK